MKPSTLHPLAVTALLSGLFVTGLIATPSAPAALDANAALVALKAGNERFLSEAHATPYSSADRREKTAEGQQPLAVVVACADSRTAPEIVFDQHLGDLFVIRTAGGLVDDYALGSIDYAVQHLGTRLVVVLGHEHCGAVHAAIESPGATGNIGALVKDIQPAVAAVRTDDDEAGLLDRAVHENARQVAAKIAERGEFGPAASEVRIVSGCYSLHTGAVEWHVPSRM